MIRYLLDTNILSYFIRGNHPALMRRMGAAMQAQTSATSAICRAEIRYGHALMAGNDKRHIPINLMLLELPALAWTADAADRYGEIRAQLRQQGAPCSEMDTMIAAHALVDELTLVTHNTRHFEQIDGLVLQDWTE